MSTALEASPHYPFNLDGPLCPLLDHGPLLLAFYDGAGLRPAIKQFCKRANWPGKPATSYAVNTEKLQELLASLFNSPTARAQLWAQGEAGRCPYLHDAIWQWARAETPALCDRIAACCEDVKDRLFLRCEPFQQLLAQVQQEQPSPQSVTRLAYLVLAFAMLQPQDRYALGELFLSFFSQGFGS